MHLPCLLISVNKHKHWDHRQNEDHRKEENDQQISSDARALKQAFQGHVETVGSGKKFKGVQNSNEVKRKKTSFKYFIDTKSSETI